MNILSKKYDIQTMNYEHKSLCLYYSESYDLHQGFHTTRESMARVNTLVSQYPCTAITSAMTASLVLDEYWQRVIAKVHARYEAIPTNACTQCTFLNPLDQPTCDMCESTVGRTKLMSPIDGDTTFACPTSTTCLTDLLKSVVWMIDSQRQYRHDAFLMSRPPGHHADNATPQGFCLVNTVVFAAEMALRHVDRVCILDWDVHHGNGTQTLVANRHDMMLIDLHRENFYPYTGTEHDIPNVVNLGLPAGSGEDEYQPAFQTAMEKMKAFQPGWILVSCGFDAHERDPLGGMKLRTETYAGWTDALRSLGVPISYVLEGGYDPDVICECVVAMKGAYPDMP